MVLRRRLLLLAALVAGVSALAGGVAVAAEGSRQTSSVDDDPIVIIRSVVPAKAPVAPSAEPVARDVTPAAAVDPPTLTELLAGWALTDSGRFLTLGPPLAAEQPDGGVAAADDVDAERDAVEAIFAAPMAALSTSVPEPTAPRPAGAAAVAGGDDAGAGAEGTLQVNKDAAARATAKARPRAADPKDARSQDRPSQEAQSKNRPRQEARPQAPRRQEVATAQRGRNPDTSQRRRPAPRASAASANRSVRAMIAADRRAVRAATVDDIPLASVRGIIVHRRIGGRTEALLRAADRAGLRLGGWGYRSTQRQIQLRRQHCGTSRYAMYRMPSGRCWPPTAPPGHSMHERGLAIDFYLKGRDGRARPIAGTRAFRWLQRNAAAYGFVNLPSEPWHWSTNGR